VFVRVDFVMYEVTLLVSVRRVLNMEESVDEVIFDELVVDLVEDEV